MSQSLVNPFFFGGGALADPTAYKELGRTELSGTADYITVSGLTEMSHLMVLNDIRYSGSANMRSSMQFNGDTAGNYSWTTSEVYGADSSATGQTAVRNSGADTWDMFVVGFIENIEDKEKLVTSATVGAGNSGNNPPNRYETAGKWANTSDQITEYSQYNDYTGDYGADSEVVVLGWTDGDDTGTPFWTELATQTVSNSSFDLSFTAKKYLWLQYSVNLTSGSGNMLMRMNSDTGSNYNLRAAYDGGAGYTQNRSEINVWDPIANGVYYNVFILNIDGNPKLIIMDSTYATTDGTSATAPRRATHDWKIENTSQITRWQDTAGSASYDGTLTVWGSD